MAEKVTPKKAGWASRELGGEEESEGFYFSSLFPIHQYFPKHKCAATKHT